VGTGDGIQDGSDEALSGTSRVAEFVVLVLFNLVLVTLQEMYESALHSRPFAHL
jgi:hypothetical protein